MLVLARKWNETIVIGDNVEITVLEIRPGRVRLGIKAPASLPVHRLEVSRRIADELTAAQPAAAATES